MRLPLCLHQNCIVRAFSITRLVINHATLGFIKCNCLMMTWQCPQYHVRKPHFRALDFTVLAEVRPTPKPRPLVRTNNRFISHPVCMFIAQIIDQYCRLFTSKPTFLNHGNKPTLTKSEKYKPILYDKL